MTEVEDTDVLNAFESYFESEDEEKEEKKEEPPKELESPTSPMTIAGYPAFDFSLLCFFITLICSTYIFNVMNMQQSKYTVVNMRNAKSPIPFFDSPNIEDYYDGRIDLGQIIHSAPFAVIIFYTPWSTRSHLSREIFHNVAERFVDDDMTKFIAVNCFNKRGSCREKYKIPTFPMIAVFTANGFLTYRGELEEENVIDWLTSIKTPYVQAMRLSAFQDIRSISENVVVGYFRFNEMENPNGFMSFYLVSMLYKKGVLADRLTTFCLIHDYKLAERIGLEDEGIYYYFGNNEYTFYDEEFLRTTEILNWIEKQREQTTGKVEMLDINSVSDVKNEKFLGVLAEDVVLLYVNINAKISTSLNNVLSFIEVSQDYWTCESDLLTKNDFNGLGCSSNDSLKFVYLPLTSGQALSKKLTLMVSDILQIDYKHSESFLLIVDEENELVTVHNSTIWNDAEIRQFIIEYHQKTIRSRLQTRMIREPSTANITTEIASIEKEIRSSVIIKTSLEDILKERMITQKDTIVFICGNRQNVFTSVALSKYHSLAQMFSRFSRHLSFKLLDITSSHLPYNLNFATLPVLMIIPKEGSDFHILSDYSEMNIPTMVNFVLEHISSRMYWHHRLKSCKALIYSKIRELDRCSLRVSEALKRNGRSFHSEKAAKKLLRRKKHYKFVADKISLSLMQKQKNCN